MGQYQGNRSQEHKARQKLEQSYLLARVQSNLKQEHNSRRSHDLCCRGKCLQGKASSYIASSSDTTGGTPEEQLQGEDSVLQALEQFS